MGLFKQIQPRIIVNQPMSTMCMEVQRNPEKKISENNTKQSNTIIRDIKNLFEQDEDYYKSLRISNFYSNNDIEYENNGDRNKTLSIKKYLDEIKLYPKDIIKNLKKSDT